MTDDPITPPPGGQPQALTDEEIEAIRQRAEAATPGPWYVSEAHASCGEVWIHTQNPPPVEALIPPYNWDDAGPNFGEARWKAYYRENIDPSLISTGWDDNPINAAFVAHARTDVPALLAALDEARARAAHFESLAKDQQATNAAMVASLQRGLAQLEASEAEVARLRDDCAALLKILDATYDGSLGRFTRDRIGEEIDAALDATPRHPELIRQAQRLPRSRASLDELRRTGQSQLGRPPAGEGYPMKTCGHPEMADRQLIAPTTFRAVCWCGRNYACPTCGFGAFTLSHECAPPAPADQARQEGADDGE